MPPLQAKSASARTPGTELRERNGTLVAGKGRTSGSSSSAALGVVPGQEAAAAAPGTY